VKKNISRTNIIQLSVLVLLITIFVCKANAGCPVGSYEWVDNWGNKICKSFESGNTTTIEGSTSRCPTGTYQWLDNWGNIICKSYQGNQQYYDTSRGCPTGMYEWLDNWGNKICKSY
jgi:hypothetical protein